MLLRSLGSWFRTWGLALLLCVAGSAQAALLLVVTSTGFIADGSDGGALTGTVFSSPAPDTLSVTMTQVFEEAPGSTVGAGFGDFTLASVTFSVNGGASTSFSGGTGVYTIGIGTLSGFVTALSGDLSTNLQVISSDITSNDVGQSLVLTSGVGGTTSVSFGANYLDDFFFVESGTVSVVARNTAPEPSTLLLAALVLGIAGARRARQPLPMHR